MRQIIRAPKFEERVISEFLYKLVEIYYTAHIPRRGHRLRPSQQTHRYLLIHIRIPAAGTNPRRDVIHDQPHLPALKIDRCQPVHGLSLPANEADHMRCCNLVILTSEARRNLNHGWAKDFSPPLEMTICRKSFFTFGSSHLSSTYSGLGHRP